MRIAYIECFSGISGDMTTGIWTCRLPWASTRSACSTSPFVVAAMFYFTNRSLPAESDCFAGGIGGSVEVQSTRLPLPQAPAEYFSLIALSLAELPSNSLGNELSGLIRCQSAILKGQWPGHASPTTARLARTPPGSFLSNRALTDIGPGRGACLVGR